MRMSDWSSDVCSSDLVPYECPCKAVVLHVYAACDEQHGGRDGFKAEGLAPGEKVALTQLVAFSSPRLAESKIRGGLQGRRVVLGSQELRGQFAPCGVRMRRDEAV